MKFVDLIGKRFGYLVVVRNTGKKYHFSTIYECECDCGNRIEVLSVHLKNGHTKSCKCFLKNEAKKQMKARKKNDCVERTSLTMLQTRKYKNNTSGTKGVSWDKRSKKWHAYLKIRGIKEFSKLFSNKEDAIKARKEAEEKYFKPILEKYGRV